MKHLLKLCIFSCFSLAIITSCSGSSETNENKSYSTYQEALADNNFQEAYAIIEKMRNAEDLFGKKYYDSDIREAKDEVYNKEVNFLAVQGTDEANKRLLVLINEEPMEGVARSEGQELDKDRYSGSANMEDLYLYDRDYSKYVKWCNKFNSKCLQILEIAVNLENKELAELMLKTIKKDPEITTQPTKGDNDHYDIYAHYTNKTKSEAIAKYEEHFGKYEGKTFDKEEEMASMQDNDDSFDESRQIKAKSKHRRK